MRLLNSQQPRDALNSLHNLGGIIAESPEANCQVRIGRTDRKRALQLSRNKGVMEAVFGFYLRHSDVTAKRPSDMAAVAWKVGEHCHS